MEEEVCLYNLPLISLILIGGLIVVVLVVIVGIMIMIRQTAGRIYLFIYLFIIVLF